jgi:hypothetical protein
MIFLVICVGDCSKLTVLDISVSAIISDRKGTTPKKKLAAYCPTFGASQIAQYLRCRLEENGRCLLGETQGQGCSAETNDVSPTRGKIAAAQRVRRAKLCREKWCK